MFVLVRHNKQKKYSAKNLQLFNPAILLEHVLAETVAEICNRETLLLIKCVYKKLLC